MTVAVFWAPGSPQIGGGHAARSFALAQALGECGVICLVLVDPATSSLMAGRFEEGASVQPVAVEHLTIATATDVCWRYAADWVVVDDYRVRADDEAHLGKSASNVLVIDDLANRPHHCDALLDVMPYRTATDYVNLVDAGTTLWIGHHYALVRRSIVARREASSGRRRIPKLESILIALGMTDPGKAINASLSAIEQAAIDVRVDVLVASETTAAALRQSRSCRAGRARIHVNVPDPSDLFCRADLAITAPGVTAVELCTLGVPLLLVETYPHQWLLGDSLVRKGAAFAIAKDELIENLACHLRTLLANPSLLCSISARGAENYDGRGADRVAALMTDISRPI